MFGPASSPPSPSRARARDWMHACMHGLYEKFAHILPKVAETCQKNVPLFYPHPKFTSVNWVKFTTEIGNCEIHVNEKISLLNEMKQNEILLN
jgi:hypothetical protein